MRLFNKKNNIENILNNYYKIKKYHLKQNIPSLPISKIIKTDTTQGRRLIINTAFTSGLVIMSVIFFITADNQSELAISIEKVFENTNVIEHIRSGSNNMFEILSKNFIEPKERKK